jgi:heme A synthase
MTFDPVLWHRSLALAVRYLFLFLALWSFSAYIRKKPVSALFINTIVITEVVIIVQALIGAYFFVLLGWRPLAWVQHLLYGGLTVFTFPVAYRYTSQEENPRRAAGIWTLACLFMFGLTFRTAFSGVMG